MFSTVKGIFKVIFHPVVRSVVEILFFITLITVIFFGTASKLPFVSNAQLMVVLSGSMKPTVKTGSLIMIKPPSELKIGDIITFVTPRTKKIVTHRILNIKEDKKNKVTNISTKGDANKSPDSWILERKHILGKLVISVPYLGYIINFSKTPKGFFLLAILPAVVIIFEELVRIKKLIQLQYENRILKLESELRVKNSNGK